MADGEVWVKNMYIAEYFYGSYNNHSARRDRKLLLTKKEIAKLGKTGKEAGFTIVPLKVFINDKGLAKMVIGIGRGKKEYDKRQSIKERDDRLSDGPRNAEIMTHFRPASSVCAAAESLVYLQKINYHLFNLNHGRKERKIV